MRQIPLIIVLIYAIKVLCPLRWIRNIISPVCMSQHRSEYIMSNFSAFFILLGPPCPSLTSPLSAASVPTPHTHGLRTSPFVAELTATSLPSDPSSCTSSPTSEAVTIGDVIIMQTLSTGVWCLSPLTSSLATIFTAYTFQMHFSNSSLWGETPMSSFQNCHLYHLILLPYYICVLTNSAPSS